MTQEQNKSPPDGGPAFPRPFVGEAPGEVGMSLRDWFASHCPESEIPTFVVRNCMDHFGISHGNQVTDEHFQILRGKARYKYADAMLKARNA